MIVDIYKNSHKTKSAGVPVYSVRYNGKVIKHVKSIKLRNVKFIVNQKRREQVIKTKRKNVHAVVRGTIDRFFETNIKLVTNVRYNPYINTQFETDYGVVVKSAYACIINKNGIQITGINL